MGERVEYFVARDGTRYQDGYWTSMPDRDTLDLLALTECKCGFGECGCVVPWIGNCCDEREEPTYRRGRMPWHDEETSSPLPLSSLVTYPRPLNTDQDLPLSR